MKPESVRIIETVLANDPTVSQEELDGILDACRGESPRKGRGAEDLQMLSTKEVASILKVSEKTVKRLLSQNNLPSLKIGKLRRVRFCDLQVFIQILETPNKSRLVCTPMGNRHVA
jgi:excisionase family DNA binding protein